MTGAHRFYRRPFTNVGNGLKKRGRGGEREREREREKREETKQAVICMPIYHINSLRETMRLCTFDGYHRVC